MNKSLEERFKFNENKLKKLYENKEYSALLDIIIEEIFMEDINNFQLDSYYACNINKIMLNIQNDINKKLLNNKNKTYESVINDIIRYWKNKLSKIKEIYSVDSRDKFYLSSQITQVQIKFIIKNIDFINKMSIKSNFIELEQLVLKEIKNQRNPFHIVSSKYPLNAIVIAVERIYEIVQNKMMVENENKKEQKKEGKKAKRKRAKYKKSKEFLYLYNIISIKNATFIMPINLQNIYFNLAAHSFSNLISEGKNVDINDIKKFLINLTEKEVIKLINNSNVLVPQETIEEYYSDEEIDEDKKNIAKYYYGQFDESFNPKDINDFNKQFGVNGLNILKEEVAIEIIKRKRKEK